MKKTRILFAIICCMAMVFSAAIGLAETTEPAQEAFSGFVSVLDYVGENGDMIECSLLIEALEGSFKTDTAAEEILIKVHPISEEELTEAFNPEEEYADVAEVTVVSNDGATLEVSFVIPRDEMNVDNFAIQGYVALADGVMLNAEGNAVGKIAELTTWNMDENARTSNGYTERDYEYSYLTLKHEGVYIAEFYVCWTEFLGYDDNGKILFKHHNWDGNNDNKTINFTTTITMKNAYDIYIRARNKTGMVWEPWHTSFNQSGLEFARATLTISGTTLNSEASFSSY